MRHVATIVLVAISVCALIVAMRYIGLNAPSSEEQPVPAPFHGTAPEELSGPAPLRGTTTDEDRENGAANRIQAADESQPDTLAEILDSALKQLLESSPHVDPDLMEYGAIQSIADAERIYSKLDRRHYDLRKNLTVYIAALQDFLETCEVPQDRARAQYLLAQASLLGRDIGPAMELLEELASPDAFDLLSPEQQISVALSRLALTYLADGGTERTRRYPPDMDLIERLALSAASLEGAGRLGFTAEDVANAFYTMAAGQADLIDEAIAFATVHYDVLRSNLNPPLSASSQHRTIAGFSGADRLISLYESPRFHGELEELRQVDLETALLIEFYALRAHSGKDSHALVYQRSMELFEQLPADHPCRPMFALLASQYNSARDWRYPRIVEYCEQHRAPEQDYARW